MKPLADNDLKLGTMLRVSKICRVYGKMKRYGDVALSPGTLWRIDQLLTRIGAPSRIALRSVSKDPDKPTVMVEIEGGEGTAGLFVESRPGPVFSFPDLTPMPSHLDSTARAWKSRKRQELAELVRQVDKLLPAGAHYMPAVDGRTLDSVLSDLRKFKQAASVKEWGR